MCIRVHSPREAGGMREWGVAIPRRFGGSGLLPFPSPSNSARSGRSGPAGGQGWLPAGPRVDESPSRPRVSNLLLLPSSCHTYRTYDTAQASANMSDAPCQRAFDPDISKFIGWVQSQSVPGILGADPDVKHPFMPLPRLEKYLKEGNTTKRLLRALSPDSEPPIEPEEVWRTCIRVFSILLLIGRGSFIPHFVQHDQLWDSKLHFFHPPRHFPPTADGDAFFASFFKKQWHFCPHTFRRSVTDAQIDKECILPVVA